MVACIDFFEMSEICRPKFIVRHSIRHIRANEALAPSSLVPLDLACASNNALMCEKYLLALGS
jgi:hypothetical protein